MMQMIGAVLLAAGCVLLGSCAVRHMNARVCEINNLTSGLNVVRRELEYRMAPLPELMEQASANTEGSVAVFFQLCSKGAEHLNGRTFQSVWKQALEAGQLRLEQTDLEVLEQLGGVLGRYDGESQMQALKAAIDRLEEQRREAEDQRNRLGKVYGVLGLTAGAFVLILMI